MTFSNLKILFYLTISLTLLFAFFSSETLPVSATSTIDVLKERGESGSASFVAFSNWDQDPERSNSSANKSASAPVHQPATLILVGIGAIGIAALRKKFNNK